MKPIRQVLFMFLMLIAPVVGHSVALKGPSTSPLCAGFLDGERGNDYLILLEHGLRENVIPLREAARVAASPLPIAPQVFNGSPEEYAALRDALNESIQTLRNDLNLWAATKTSIERLLAEQKVIENENRVAADDTNFLFSPHIALELELSGKHKSVTLTKDGQILSARLNESTGRVEFAMNDSAPALLPNKYQNLASFGLKQLVTQQNRLILGIFYSQKDEPEKKIIEVYEIKDGQVLSLFKHIVKSATYDLLELIEHDDGKVAAIFTNGVFKTKKGNKRIKFTQLESIKEGQAKEIYIARLRDGMDYATFLRSGPTVRILFIRKTQVDWHHHEKYIEVYNPITGKMIYQLKSQAFKDLNNPNVLPTMDMDTRNYYSFLVDRQGHEWMTLIDFGLLQNMVLINLTKGKSHFFDMRNSYDLGEQNVRDLGLNAAVLIQLEKGQIAVLQNAMVSLFIVPLNTKSSLLHSTMLKGFEQTSFNFSREFTTKPVQVQIAGVDYWIVIRETLCYLLDKNFEIVEQKLLPPTDKIQYQKTQAVSLKDGQIHILKWSEEAGKSQLIKVFSQGRGSR